MERVNRIIKHPAYIDHLSQNCAAEAGRRFCHHDMAHFLDVARIGQIMNLEEGLGIPKELVYAAALLHDIGKHIQYERGTPHEQAGGEIAPIILEECGFSKEETQVIIDAILSHRDESAAGEKSLRGILYRADKAGRACFVCEAEQECNWKDGKKNFEIYW